MNHSEHENLCLKELFSYGPYSLEEKVKNDLLLNSVLYELRYHHQNNPYYRRYCERKRVDLDTIDSLDELPFIPATAFKELGNLLVSVDEKDIVANLNSSATSGIPSSVRIDKITSRRQVKALGLVIGDRLGKKRRPFFVIDVDPRYSAHRTMSARTAAVSGFLNLASSSEYLLSDEKEGLHLDEKRLVGLIKELSNQPVILFGFTFVIYKEVIDKFFQKGRQLALPAGSMLVHIGGWKKLEHQKVNRETFNSRVQDVFAVRPQNVVDFYGFTEQMGVTYPDCECGWKHTPSFAEVRIRNEGDLSLVNGESSGLMELITPIPHSYPGNVILTDDIGILAPRDSAPCVANRSGSRFRVIGRAIKGEPRGCGDIMAEKLTPNLSIESGANDDIRLLYQYARKESVIDLPVLEGVVRDIKESQKWLQDQHVDLLIGLIHKVSRKWHSPGFALKEYQQQGLSFLCDWCTSDNLKGIADKALNNRGYLDQFLKMNDDSLKLLKANPRGLAVHWLSGNIPVLGMLVLIQTIISKNANILKSSHSYSDAIPHLLREFEDEVYRSPGGGIIKGNDLLKTISVVYFDRNNREASEYLSNTADIRIAWGGRESVHTVINLPRKHTTEDIIFGPKLSFMAIGREYLEPDRAYRKLVRKASVDSMVFDQTACASPHTIFVENGGTVSPREFAEDLAGELAKTSLRFPPNEMDDQLRTSIESKRISYEFVGDVWKPDDYSWTVLHDDGEGLAAPTYGRVITVRPVEDIFSTIDFIDGNIQTIGLALCGRRRLDYARAASDNGVDRLPTIGMMTHFEDPWDGVFVLQRAVKWKVLGGPH